MRHVLLVDDEPGVASLVSLCLDSLGVAVLPAAGLDEALEILRTDEVHLVLLDLALGGEDGLEILPRLRAEPALDNVPVVAFTAHDSRRREALDKGAAGFVARPFASDELRSTVEHLLPTV
ncbi:MAG TPA: response regulator [Acidimicrobiales bacterium]|nr:response regulator [Acidimicrobiales bacterium]